MHFQLLDIVNIAALSLEQIKDRLKDMDVIVMGGGSPLYLIEQIRLKQLEELLKQWFDSKVYVGISAGSMILGNAAGPDKPGLGIVDLIIVPHKDNEFYAKRTEEVIRENYAQHQEDIYWLDDKAGVIVDNTRVEVVGANYKIIKKAAGDE